MKLTPTILLSLTVVSQRGTMLGLDDIGAISCSKEEGPVRTAAEDLRSFLWARNGGKEIPAEADEQAGDAADREPAGEADQEASAAGGAEARED